MFHFAISTELELELRVFCLAYERTAIVTENHLNLQLFSYGDFCQYQK